MPPFLRNLGNYMFYQLAFCSNLSLSAISAINSEFVGLPL